MTKYKGIEVEVRFATTQAGLSSASAIPSVASCTWKVDQGITQVAAGLGSRASVGKEGMIKISGDVTRDYDETVVDGTNTFAQESNTFETTALTHHWLEYKVTTTGAKYQFGNVIGTYDGSVPSVDGVVTEKFTWTADSITKTS